MSKSQDPNVPTACVRKKGISCELAVNPEYWETLNDATQLALLQHECYHMVFQHMFMWDSFSNKEILGIAADCEVNSFIRDIKEYWVTPAKFGLPSKKGTKFYYEQLMKQSGTGDSKTVDDHSSWGDFGDCSDAEKQLIKNQIEAQIKTAAEQTEKINGSIPAEMTELVKELFKVKPRIFDWKAYFRRMLGSIYDIEMKKTRRKESIRFPESAGLKHKKKISILVAVDTSASVEDAELVDFFSEITHIYKSGARITVLECDAKIQAQYEFTGKWEGKVHGRGGTRFEPVIDFYRKNAKEYSALVYFTDGECSIPQNVPRGTVWIITSNGARQDYPGKTVYIPKKE